MTQPASYPTVDSAPTSTDAPIRRASPKVAVSRFFGRYATFAGRSSRSEYWWIALLNVIVFFGGSLLALVIQSAVVGQTATGTGETEFAPAAVVVMVVMVLYFLAVFIPGIALTVRRLHDIDFSGGWILLALFPTFGAIVLLVFTLLPSNPEGARFDR
ncbi:uncharacterized membrane protein YhaH (DUF805 family) [Mycetocola sp. CAN_C7]|uniref:DUF805 domain-containing protein n=1 Tax=Mycetocola sp. CAN_C7 TaxID=2787724 RepID=UPI0018C96276